MSSRRKRVKEEEFLKDPLDFDIPGEEICLTQLRTPWNFTITTDSYISLCSHVYAALCHDNAKLAQDVPESVFQCYAIIYLWKRFADILPSCEKDVSPFFNDVTQINDYFCDIPPPLHKYLYGIGHFRDPHHYDRRFVLPAHPNVENVGGIPYTFGQVNSETHYLYEAYPAPGIAVLRMLADIRYTDDPSKENLIWDLPAGLRPHFNGSKSPGKPTRNLLGWAPAQTLSHRQLELLRPLINDRRYMWSREAFHALLQRLFSLMSNYIPANQLMLDLVEEGALTLNPDLSRGSIAQGVVIKKTSDSIRFDRSSLYCEGTIAVFSPYKVKHTLTKGAAVTGYRMAKEPIGNRHGWAAYDFDEYTSVPESWIQTRNTIYTYGMVDGLNKLIFSTGNIDKTFLQNNLIRSSMIKIKNWLEH